MLKRDADRIGLGVKLIAVGLLILVVGFAFGPDTVTPGEIENARLWLTVEEFEADTALAIGRLDEDVHEVILRGIAILRDRLDRGDVGTVREILRLDQSRVELLKKVWEPSG